MIGEISPLVKAAGRRTWFAAVVSHSLGATGSAALLGGALGAIGVSLALHDFLPVASVGGVVLLGAALRDARLISLPLPSLERQTPHWFKTQFAPTWRSFLWGADLGQGWTTRIAFTSFYALTLIALLQPEVATSVMVVAAFGLGRSLPVFAAGSIGAMRSFRELRKWAPFDEDYLRRVNVFALAAIGTILVLA
jgi:cytochrome c biogenesis protein CcdA